MRKHTLALALVLVALVNCAKANEPANNLIDVLEADGRFTTLLTIVRQDAAERFLAFMTSDRRLTLFAPPDEAFDALRGDDMQAILEDGDKTRDLLAHHLAEPTLSLADLEAKARSSNPLLSTGGCCQVRLTVGSDQLKVNNATVVEADIEASNGLIHVVDQVIESVPL